MTTKGHTLLKGVCNQLQSWQVPEISVTRKLFATEKGKIHNLHSVQVVGSCARIQPMKSTSANLNCAAAPREVPAGSWDRVLQITLLGCYQTPVALLYIYSFNSRLNQLTPGRKPCTNCLPHVRLTAANCTDGKTISLHFNTVLVDDSHSCSGQGRLCRAQNAAHCRERQTWTTAPQNLPSSLSGVGDHHLKLRSAAGLQIRLSEMQTNFLNSYFLSGKGRENFTRSVCLRIFFSNFSWPHSTIIWRFRKIKTESIS